MSASLQKSNECVLLRPANNNNFEKVCTGYCFLSNVRILYITITPPDHDLNDSLRR